MAIAWYLNSMGIDWLEPEKNPKIVTRSSNFSRLNIIILTMQTLFIFAKSYNIFARKKAGEPYEWGPSEWGRFLSFFFVVFFYQIILRVIYEIQIKCGCDAKEDPLVAYLQIIRTFIPIIFNIIFVIFYGLFCMYFYCGNVEENVDVGI